MNPIAYTTVVTALSKDFMASRINDAVNDAQDDGLEVEVQFAYSQGIFTALIVARSPA